MILSLITETQYTSLHLPARREGRFLLRDPEENYPLFEITGEENEWRIGAVNGSRFVDEAPRRLENGMEKRVRIGIRLDPALLCAQEEAPRYAKFARCMVPDTASFSVGTNRDNDFVCASTLFSPVHFRLICKNRAWAVQDADSRTGTYVNGLRVRSRQLQPGDMVSAMNQKFIVLPGMLIFNDQSLADSDGLKARFQTIKAPPLPLEHPLEAEGEKPYFHRAPRFTQAMDEDELTVNAPPSRPKERDSVSALLSYGPAVTSGLGMLLGGMANPITGISMLASAILWPGLNQKRGQKLMKEEEEKRQQQYKEYMAKVDHELEELHARQTDFLRRQTTAPRIEAAQLLENNKQLWNRRPAHGDFIDVRLGIGDVPVKAKISFPPEAQQADDDPMTVLLREVEEKPRTLNSVPIILPLGKYYSVGISGPQDARDEAALRVFLQLAMHCGYDEMKLCVLGELDETLEPLRWLPHTWDDRHAVHLVAEDQDEAARLMPYLDQLLSRHQKRPQEPGMSAGELVFLITDAEMAHSGLLSRMLFQKDYERVRILSLAEHSNQLPRRMDAIIAVRKSRCRMVWQEGEKRNTVDFTPDEPIGEKVRPLVSMMANTRLDVQMETRQMPDVVPFLDLFGVRNAAHLNILDRWEHADPVHSLRVPIGVSEDGNPCLLDLHEKGDGPHGLIAGTTGSGKSELIMAYILSAAVTFSPREITFVLIDYKGGGMAQAFAQLPHTVGIITNLDGSAINRSLLSIKSELQRRQRFFAETERKLGCKKLDIYRYQQYYREGKVVEPLPHLVIITDEFAELKTQQPDFLQELISAARIGRSLGVHLILATQKPSGVVDDQIWSNSNFHLCLRVQDPRDSQDVLKCPDAALLNHVGRFYKQVGYGETLIQAQSAWTGADYLPDMENVPNCGVEVLDHSGAVLRREEITLPKRMDAQSQIDAVTDYIAALAQREGISARPLWMPVLEEKIPLDDLYRRYPVEQRPWYLHPVVGEMDDPACQRRALVRLPLSNGKNTVVYGGIGSGKLMFLITVLYDLLRRHTADQLQIYLLDYADDGLQAFFSAPQVGDVLYSDDDEKLRRLLQMMEKEIAERKKRLGGAMAAQSLEERLAGAGICNLLIVMHHIAHVQTKLDEMGLLERWIALMGDGPRYGVSFLATDTSANGMRFKLQQRFAQRFVLQMEQEEDYVALLGRTGGMKPSDVRGRGLIRDENLYEFQTAAVEEDMEVFCRRLKEQWTGPSARPIRVLPEKIMPEDMEALLLPQRPLLLPVGLDVRSIEPVYYPFDQRRVHVILGGEVDLRHFLRGLTPLLIHNGAAVTALDPLGLLEGAPGVEFIGAATLPGYIHGMYEECKQIKREMSQGGNAPERQTRVVLLPSLHSALSLLDEDAGFEMRNMLSKARPEWGWTFLLCDSAQDFGALQYKMENSDWIASSLRLSEGLYLGGGLNMQSTLQLRSAPPSPRPDIVFPRGYVVRDGEVKAIQFVADMI